MKLKPFGVWSALALLVATTACQKASPTRPSDGGASVQTTASVTDAVTGVTLTAPSLVTPTVNQQFKNVEQPITLTIKNAVTTGRTALTYTFEVATDAAFASKVYTKDGVAAGSGGTTSLTIDKLTPDKSYFWRALASSGSLNGPYTDARGVGIGPEVTLTTPVLASPGSGTTVGGQPVLTVNNVQKTGPAGPVVYRFEVSTSSSFADLAAVNTVAERGESTTSTTINANLGNGNYFWRVQASDPSNAITTPFSSVNSFTVQLFSIAQAIIWNNPADFKSWAETATITSIEFTNDAMLVDFDKRDGPGRWPDVGFGTGSLEYTLGMCVNITNQWHCSATIQFWYGRDLAASGRPSEIGINWWYDQRWGRLLGYQPSYGETIGMYVAAGNLRDSGNVIVKERSNVVLMPFGGTYRAGAGISSALRRR